MSLFEGVHDVLTGAMECIYQDAVYISVDFKRQNDFQDASDCVETEYPCKIQIDTNRRDQRNDSGVNTREGLIKILTQTLPVIPKPQDRIRYAPIGDDEHLFKVIDLVDTDPVNTYYKVKVER